jgi:dGTPase
MAAQVFRDTRCHCGKPKTKDGGEPRSAAQRDRDRLIYSSALRRLAEVTQVVSPESGYVFHNRLTHTLQVAQVGRRLAERLIHFHPKEVEQCNGLDPDVVETACLAHDLGHPPFGHLAETALNAAMEDAGGFEGNAQSFRIVNSLAFHSKDYEGLDLTRASLCAILKYPWKKGGNDQKPDKWGAYESERKEFEFARKSTTVNEACLEARLMDLADDITYSVHDMEDFYRAGLIPLHLLATPKDDRERKRFFDDVFRRNAKKPEFANNRPKLEAAFVDMVSMSFWVTEPYSGTKEHRAALRGFTGVLIDRYIRAIQLQIRGTKVIARIDEDYENEMAMFKQLIWSYVIDAPNLATQQVGQARMIKRLFEEFCASALSKNPKLFPAFYRERLAAAADDLEKKRACSDFISGLTEVQCANLYRRISGVSVTSATEGLPFL